MVPKVIGVTTDSTSIAEMLGVEGEANYGLYQETQMGKYYARFLPDGTFEEKVVHLVSDEQAAKLEASAIDVIDDAEEMFQQIIARTGKMRQKLKSNLEHTGFRPAYDNN